MSQSQNQSAVKPTSLVKAPPFQVQRAARIDMSLPIWQAVKRAYCEKATNDEFEVLCRVVEVTNLDIFNREIYWIPKIGTYISHKGYWALAMRSGQFDGFEPHQYYWIDDKGVINQERKGQLFSVKATCWRKDMRFPVIFEALWSEWEKCESQFFDKNKNEWVTKENPNWTGRPEHMLTVKAERGALAQAFTVSGVAADAKVDDDALPTFKMPDGAYAIASAAQSPPIPLPTPVPPAPAPTPPQPAQAPTQSPSPVSAGSGERKEESQAHGAPPAPPEKPAVFTAPARARAELFNLLNEGVKHRVDTPANMMAYAFERKISNDDVQKIDDIEALNKAYGRLSELVDGAKKDRAAAK